jgi:hypothetical protein
LFLKKVKQCGFKRERKKSGPVLNRSIGSIKNSVVSIFFFKKQVKQCGFKRKEKKLSQVLNWSIESQVNQPSQLGLNKSTPILFNLKHHVGKILNRRTGLGLIAMVQSPPKIGLIEYLYVKFFFHLFWRLKSLRVGRRCVNCAEMCLIMFNE